MVECSQLRRALVGLEQVGVHHEDLRYDGSQAVGHLLVDQVLVFQRSRVFEMDYPLCGLGAASLTSEEGLVPSHEAYPHSSPGLISSVPMAALWNSRNLIFLVALRQVMKDY